MPVDDVGNAAKLRPRQGYVAAFDPNELAVIGRRPASRSAAAGGGGGMTPHAIPEDSEEPARPEPVPRGLLRERVPAATTRAIATRVR